MEIELGREGVFSLANPVSRLGYTVSGTLQGEGIWEGMPTLFVRLWGCNLRCVWYDVEGQAVGCDTPSSWSEPAVTHTVSEVADTIEAHLGNIRHVVISGGEPLRQSAALLELIEVLRCRWQRQLKITVETNGTIYHPFIARSVDLVSLSPKLHWNSAKGTSLTQQEYLSSLCQWLEATEEAGVLLQCKFVVSILADALRIRELYNPLLRGIPSERIFVMPACRNAEELKRNSRVAVEIALREGWRYANRLQLALWSGSEGV